MQVPFFSFLFFFFNYAAMLNDGLWDSEQIWLTLTWATKGFRSVITFSFLSHIFWFWFARGSSAACIKKISQIFHESSSTSLHFFYHPKFYCYFTQQSCLVQPNLKFSLILLKFSSFFVPNSHIFTPNFQFMIFVYSIQKYTVSATKNLGVLKYFLGNQQRVQVLKWGYCIKQCSILSVPLL